MRTLLLRTLLLGLVAAVPLGLTACQTETEVEREPDGDIEIERRPGIDEDAVGDAVDDAGDAIEEGAHDAADAVDDAVHRDTLNNR